MTARDLLAGASIGSRIWQLTGVACAALLALSALVAWNLERSREADGWVLHTQKVLRSLGNYTREIVDAESGQRGFLLTGQAAYLAPYDRVLADHQRKFDTLNAMVTAESERIKLAQLVAIMDQKLRELGITIQLAKSGNPAGALAVVREGRGRRYTVAFQRLSREIATEETTTLAAREAAAVREGDNLLAVVLLGGVLTLMLIVGTAARTIMRIDGPLRDLLHGIAALAADDLGVRVEVRSNDEIGRVARAFNAMADDLLAANEARVHVEDELRRSNADLDSFAYSASHDLKAPLRGIRSLAEWITEDVKSTASDETIENLRLLSSRADRLDMLLQSLLQYARVGRSGGPQEDIDCSRLTEDITSYLAPRDGFTVTWRGESPVIRTDKAPLEQVLRNLISNGLKHHDRGTGSVVVSARDLGDRLEFRVEDDGPGIPATSISASSRCSRRFGLAMRSREAAWVWPSSRNRWRATAAPYGSRATRQAEERLSFSPGRSIDRKLRPSESGRTREYRLGAKLAADAARWQIMVRDDLDDPDCNQSDRDEKRLDAQRSETLPVADD
jgi:signal transduction histidine kinase